MNFDLIKYHFCFKLELKKVYCLCTHFIEIGSFSSCSTYLAEVETKKHINKETHIKSNSANSLVNRFTFILVRGKELNKYIEFISAFNLDFCCVNENKC